MKLLVGISGASGSIYGVRLLEELRKHKHETILVVSSGAKKILEHETAHTYDTLKTYASSVFDNDQLFAGPASGSFFLDGMVVVPCSMKTLAAIAHGYADTLITRAATCCLKEGRKLVLVPRETPLDLAALTNMVFCRQNGAVILPATPGFYHQPQTVDDLVDFVVGKILDQFGINHRLYKKWK